MPHRQRIRKARYLGANCIWIEPSSFARGRQRIPAKLRAECRDRVDTIGMVHCHVRGDVTTHAVAKQPRTVDTQRVKQVDDILGEELNSKCPLARRRVRVTLEIELVNAVVRPENGGEAVELTARAKGAMQKDEVFQGTGAGFEANSFVSR